MKEIRAVLAQMMFLQLWFEAESTGYRAEAASTAANIDLCWKVGKQAQPSPGFRILHGISSFPELSLDFSWPVLAMRKIWPLVKLPCSRKKAFDGLKVPVHQPGLLLSSQAWEGSQTAQHLLWLLPCPSSQKWETWEEERQLRWRPNTSVFGKQFWKFCSDL